MQTTRKILFKCLGRNIYISVGAFGKYTLGLFEIRINLRVSQNCVCWSPHIFRTTIDITLFGLILIVKPVQVLIVEYLKRLIKLNETHAQANIEIEK